MGPLVPMYLRVSKWLTVPSYRWERGYEKGLRDHALWDQTLVLLVSLAKSGDNLLCHVMYQHYGVWGIFGIISSTGQMFNSVHAIYTCDPEVKTKWHNVYKVLFPYRKSTHVRCLYCYQPSSVWIFHLTSETTLEKLETWWGWGGILLLSHLVISKPH